MKELLICLTSLICFVIDWNSERVSTTSVSINASQLVMALVDEPDDEGTVYLSHQLPLPRNRLKFQESFVATTY